MTAFSTISPCRPEASDGTYGPDAGTLHSSASGPLSTAPGVRGEICSGVYGVGVASCVHRCRPWPHGRLKFPEQTFGLPNNCSAQFSPMSRGFFGRQKLRLTSRLPPDVASAPPNFISVASANGPPPHSPPSSRKSAGGTAFATSRLSHASSVWQSGCIVGSWSAVQIRRVAPSSRGGARTRTVPRALRKHCCGTFRGEPVAPGPREANHQSRQSALQALIRCGESRMQVTAFSSSAGANSNAA